jgi:hypothetical protein
MITQPQRYFIQSLSGFPLAGNLLLYSLNTPSQVGSEFLAIMSQNVSAVTLTALFPSDHIPFIPKVSRFMFHRFFQFYLLKPKKGHSSSCMTQCVYL